MDISETIKSFYKDAIKDLCIKVLNHLSTAKRVNRNRLFELWDEKNSEGKCIYISPRVENEKNEKCGLNISIESESDNYCRKHLYLEKPIKFKKLTESEKRKELTKEILKKKSAKTIIIVRHSEGFLYHQESKFVVDPDKINNKLIYIIGKYKDRKVVDLNEQDIAIAKSYGFDVVIPLNIMPAKVEDEKADDEDIPSIEELDSHDVRPDEVGIDDDVEENED